MMLLIIFVINVEQDSLKIMEYAKSYQMIVILMTKKQDNV